MNSKQAYALMEPRCPPLKIVEFTVLIDGRVHIQTYVRNQTSKMWEYASQIEGMPHVRYDPAGKNEITQARLVWRQLRKEGWGFLA